MTDEPVFSARAVRDEDTRADALGYIDAGAISYLEEETAAERHARFCLLVEASFTEYERRHRDEPETLTPIAGYAIQTPGTYGAEITPVFLQVMQQIMDRHAAPVFILR